MTTKSSQKGKTKVVATDYDVYHSGVTNAATVIQAVMDKEFIEKCWDSGRGRFWTDFKGAVDSDGKPLESNTWYRINREKGGLEKVSEEEANKLGRDRWSERLYVVSEVSVKEHNPVSVEVNNYRARLEIYDNCNSLCHIPIAQIDSKQSDNEELLRK